MFLYQHLIVSIISIKEWIIFNKKRKTNQILKTMNGFFKTIIAGYGAKKMGCGCVGTVIMFIIIYWNSKIT
jgi:hypothetical protein